MSQSNENIASVKTWLAMPMDASVKHVVERVRRADDVVHVAVMPDVHLAGDVCVGTAMATRRLIYPSAVGGDIGCGMLAMAFDAAAGIGRAHYPCRQHCGPAIFRTHSCSRSPTTKGNSNSAPLAAAIISSKCRRMKPASSGS